MILSCLFSCYDERVETREGPSQLEERVLEGKSEGDSDEAYNYWWVADPLTEGEVM